MITSVTTSAGIMWNGGVCGTCGARYLDSHYCTSADILRRMSELMELLAQLQSAQPIAPVDRMAGCPCRPENGGSGVCGCILGGPQITC